MADSALPITYTENPFLLFLKDFGLFFTNLFTRGGLLGIILPLTPRHETNLDELYPSRQNIWAVILHGFLVITQLLFLASLLPLSILTPLPILYFFYVVGVVIGNRYFTILLNGKRRCRLFRSNDEYVRGRKVDEHEKWVFINGVAVGKTWLQANLDKLALTFRRPIYGIHNQTRGIVFDVLESIIQRDFSYATLDIRQAYSALFTILNDKNIHKVVLILHSQGAIEGGLALNWLYATLSADQMSKLEIYTFGNAANHWNSPSLTTSSNTGGSGEAGSARLETPQLRRPGSIKGKATTTIRHIEHYANLRDYVSRGGILHFRPDPDPTASDGLGPVHSNRFVGRLFKNDASGHLLNQHYLNYFFQVDSTDPATGKVVEDNEYMNSLVDVGVFERWDTVQVDDDEGRTDGTRIKDLSRLWRYRNGKSPDDSDDGQG